MLPVLVLLTRSIMLVNIAAPILLMAGKMLDFVACFFLIKLGVSLSMYMDNWIYLFNCNIVLSRPYNVSLSDANGFVCMICTIFPGEMISSYSWIESNQFLSNVSSHEIIYYVLFVCQLHGSYLCHLFFVFEP